MVKYKLIKETNETITYEYYPEGESEKGIIEFDRKTKEQIKYKLAPNDTFKWYFYHICKHVREEGFKQEGIVAWY